MIFFYDFSYFVLYNATESINKRKYFPVYYINKKSINFIKTVNIFLVILDQAL